MTPPTFLPGDLVVVSPVPAAFHSVNRKQTLRSVGVPMSLGVFVANCSEFDQPFIQDVFVLHPWLGLIRTYESQIKRVSRPG